MAAAVTVVAAVSVIAPSAADCQQCLLFCGIVQEELKILRLRYSVLQEEELENREKELMAMLKTKKAASVRGLFSCSNV